MNEYNYSYIASGGIGNRAAAISSFIYDKFSMNCKNVSLVWNSHIMENSFPEQLWENWDLEYYKSPIHNANSLNWYIHARVVKNELVKNWWKNLVPTSFVRKELESFSCRYDCGVVIRNLRFSKTELKYEQIIKECKLRQIKNILVVGDDDVEIENFMNFCEIPCFKYKNASHVKDDNEIRSHEHTLSSLVEWYAIQRCNILFKNTPVSTFSDYCEFMLDIPTFTL